MTTKDPDIELPLGWKYKGVVYKGPRDTPVWVFKNSITGQSKGFSVWVVQPPTRRSAFREMKKWLETIG